MQAGYSHGCHTCKLCHPTGQETTIVAHQWRLTHWPAYWGDANPDVLVLGFSMGATQISAAKSKPFDQVAFAGCRIELRAVLIELGIDLHGQAMDELMSSRGKSLGFSSLARCSLELWEDGAFKTSGKIMSVAPNDPWAGKVMAQCISTYLPGMPHSVRRVVLLGTSDAFVKGIRRMVRQAFEDYADINDMAFSAGGRTWVFAVHPKAQANGADKWVKAEPDSVSGRKREHAKLALARSYAADMPAQVMTSIGRRTLLKKATV